MLQPPGHIGTHLPDKHRKKYLHAWYKMQNSRWVNPPKLADLFNKYGSDKDRNGYSPYYESLFNRLRNERFTMLEIGIGTMIPNVHSSMVGYALDGYKPGGSLRAWRDYFPTAWIFGADVQPDTQFADEERIETLLMDSTNLNECERVLSYHVFNIIIDDGSHLDTSQLLTLRNLWKRVRPNGYYIIEDVYPGSRITTDFLSDIQAIIGPDASYFFSEKKNLMIIYKHA